MRLIIYFQFYKIIKLLSNLKITNNYCGKAIIILKNKNRRKYTLHNIYMKQKISLIKEVNTWVTWETETPKATPS